MVHESESDHDQQRFSYPVSLDLRGVLVLVVGGGPVGARKVAGLARAGALVRLVAREVGDHIVRRSVSEVHEREFAPGDLDGVRLVVTATGIATVDASIAAAARERGIWVNAADQPDDCDFILPAVHRSGRVTVAIGTDGASPALAQWLRDRVGELLDDHAGGDVAALAEELSLARDRIHADGGSTEEVDWPARIKSVLSLP
jgi:precorrin-2 dehydrogenase/sirohydrochlorin ferrochelatase